MPLTKSCVLTIIWRYENTKQLLAGQGARTAGEGGRYMRVIAGEARGRRLEALPGTEITRPTMDHLESLVFIGLIFCLEEVL